MTDAPPVVGGSIAGSPRIDHVALRLDVDDLVRRLGEAGVPVVDGPRVTGDGYYEAVLLDPEGNRVEVVAGDYPEEVAMRGATA